MCWTGCSAIQRCSWPRLWQIPAVPFGFAFPRIRLLGCWLAFALVTGTAGAAETTAPSVLLSEAVPGAARLEGRLLAPCCWNQTLDTHSSELALELRREIRSRLKAGERPDAIEASLVERYGTRIRAVPDRVPLGALAGLALVGFLGVGGGAGYLLIRWRRRAVKASTGASSVVSGDSLPDAERRLDARLDAELARMD